MADYSKGHYVWIGEDGSPFYYDSTPEDRIKYNAQRSKAGVGDDETFAIDKTLAVFILPRLKRFREVMNGYPSEMTWEEWQNTVDEIIWFFEQIDNGLVVPNGEDSISYYEKVQKAQELFGKYLTALWW